MIRPSFFNCGSPMPKKQNWRSISFFHLAHLLAVLVGSPAMAKGVILSCLFVTVMFCCTGCAWACGAALLLGTAEAASSESPIFYLCYLRFFFLYPVLVANVVVGLQDEGRQVYAFTLRCNSL